MLIYMTYSKEKINSLKGFDSLYNIQDIMIYWLVKSITDIICYQIIEVNMLSVHACE